MTFPHGELVYLHQELVNKAYSEPKYYIVLGMINDFINTFLGYRVEDLNDTNYALTKIQFIYMISRDSLKEKKLNDGIRLLKIANGEALEITNPIEEVLVNVMHF